MLYFRIKTDDKRFAERWFLGEPLSQAGEPIDAREFWYGQVYDGPTPAVVPIQQSGIPVAFNLAAFDMPVVSSSVGDLIEAISPADIQRFAVRVGNRFDGYEILNVVGQEKCVDEVHAQVRKWGPEDGQPDRIGEYMDIEPLLIDPLKTNGRHLLRIWGSLLELIVSNDVKAAIEHIPDLGIIFSPVTYPLEGATGSI